VPVEFPSMDEVSCCGTAVIFGGIGLLTWTPAGWWRMAAGLAVVLAMLAGLAFGAQAPRGTALRPGHVITGTVKNPAGRPVSDVFVTALLRDERSSLTGADGVERPYRIASARLGAVTGTNGRYELELPHAGEFFLVALPRYLSAGAAPSRQRNGYGHTFYPGAARFADAVPVQVQPGAGITADLTLIAAKLAVISGTVFDSTGQPAKGGRLAMAHGEGFFGVNGRTISFQPGGRFAIPNLPPGTYFLHYRESTWPPPSGTVPLMSTAKVVVNGEDIRGVRVMPTKPVRVTGRLIIEPRRSDARPGSITVSAIPMPIDGNPGPSYPGAVTPEGTFEFRGWPLRSRIRVFADGQEWTVKTVRLSGRELPNGIIDLEQLRDVTGVEVVVR
jgi:hypothetical protein